MKSLSILPAMNFFHEIGQETSHNKRTPAPCSLSPRQARGGGSSRCSACGTSRCIHGRLVSAGRCVKQSAGGQEIMKTKRNINAGALNIILMILIVAGANLLSANKQLTENVYIAWLERSLNKKEKRIVFYSSNTQNLFSLTHKFKKKYNYSRKLSNVDWFKVPTKMSRDILQFTGWKLNQTINVAINGKILKSRITKGVFANYYDGILALSCQIAFTKEIEAEIKKNRKYCNAFIVFTNQIPTVKMKLLYLERTITIEKPAIKGKDKRYEKLYFDIHFPSNSQHKYRLKYISQYPGNRLILIGKDLKLIGQVFGC